MSEQNLENREQEYTTSILKDTMIIGFTGGILMGIIVQLAFYFNFLDFSPRFILTPWTTLAWVRGWIGIVMSVLLFGILSILAAIVYHALLKRVQSIYAGLLYGVLLWLILVFILRPMFPDFPTYAAMNTRTIVTSVCIFIVYGVFVGYSISYEHQEIQKKNNAKSETDIT